MTEPRATLGQRYDECGHSRGEGEIQLQRLDGQRTVRITRDPTQHPVAGNCFGALTELHTPGAATHHAAVVALGEASHARDGNAHQDSWRRSIELATPRSMSNTQSR
ncbi:MAG: hypothetical protein ABIT20_21650 [Gemmatimonadaceae bacterium]